MILEIHIKKEAYQEIISIKNKLSSKEVCGLLFGKIVSENIRQIEEIVLVANKLKSLHSFAISKTDFERELATNNNWFLGYFHTHSKSSELSENDIISIKKSKCIWLIITALKKDNLHFYYFKNNCNEILKINNITLCQ